MNNIYIYSILVIGLISCIDSAHGWNGFNSIVSRLAQHQTPSGGFRGGEGKVTTEATANALLLASLYGLRNKINTTEAAKFIKSVENNDGGYGPAPGSPSDVESVRFALLSLQHLGLKSTNPTNVVNYIKTLLDNNNNLFSVRVGEKGSIKGTALALQSLDSLGELSQKWVQSALPQIKEVLEKHRKTDGLLHFSFPEEKAVSESQLEIWPTFEFYWDWGENMVTFICKLGAYVTVLERSGNKVTANHYAIVVGKYVGFDFEIPENWAKFVTSLQSTAGHFYDSTEKKTSSLASTAHAIYSLSALSGLKGAGRFLDSVNVDSLKSAVRHIVSDISAAAHAHSALALTNAFKNFFHTAVNYEGTDPLTGHIIEGSSFKPSISISSLFDDNTANPHGDFEVSSSTAFHGKDAIKGKLTWDQELHRYVGEHLPTIGNLGAVKLLFSLVHKVAGLGNISFELAETQNIGYGLDVSAKVSQDGRAVQEGESVSVGTSFKFDVVLYTRSNENLLSGSCIVTFSVLDSSLVTVHETKVNGTTNTAPISFDYKLSSPALPPGHLSFRFDVAGKGAPHTTRTLIYQYTTPLVATNIQFDGIAGGQAPTFKLGDKVKITIDPAAFPDLSHVFPLPTNDGSGANIADSRHFFLDISSSQGVLLRSIPSATTKGSSKYFFETTVEATLDSIGTNVLSFRYIPAVGDEVHLQNYDSSTKELYEDVNVLNFTVKADLSLELTEAPKAGNLFYGSVVHYKFQVRDTLSKQHVYIREGSPAKIFLDLQHEEAGSRLYSSLHLPATVSAEGKNKAFSIDWVINPNAVQGNGSLSLSILDADGTIIPLKGSNPLKVDIGGDIEVESHTYTTSALSARQSAITAEFGLSCLNKPLKDADLLCNVVNPAGDVVVTLPVAHHEGKYTVSWTAPHKQIPSANYKLLFFRNIDRTRAQERKEQREKRERKERLLRGEDTAPATTADEGLNLQPLFVVEVSHSAPRLVSLPVRAEFLAVSLLGSFLGWLVYKKNNLK